LNFTLLKFILSYYLRFNNRTEIKFVKYGLILMISQSVKTKFRISIFPS